MSTKCHLIIRTDEFLPVNMANLVQILRLSIGDFDRLTFCPTNSLAQRFKRHFESLQEQLKISFDTKEAKDLALEARGDCFVVLVQSDLRVGPGWLRTLVDQAKAVPRFATLSPTLISGRDLQRLRGLKDGHEPESPQLNFPDILNAL
ncbi:MAG: hypothetical protein K2X47_00005, partial [Bdellovibrionales bacterium]|nr:hypothetical protein [Bdellovibrionales bacterium]